MPHDNAVNIQSSTDYSDVSHTITIRKLDADQYSVDDIDGVTESLFGSGNLAYASLQASQTDAAIALNTAVTPETGHISDLTNMHIANGPLPSGPEYINMGPVDGISIPTDTDRPLDTSRAEAPDIISAEGNFSHGTLGALGAAALSSDAGLSPASAFSHGGFGDLESISNSASSNTVTNNNITNTVANNVGDTVENIINTVNQTIENITNLGDELIENLIEGDVGDVINIVTTEIDDITNLLNSEINNLTETVTNILNDTGITEITNHVTEITNNVTETVTNTIDTVLDTVLGDGGISINLSGSAFDALGADIGITIDNGISGQISTDLVSGNAAAIVSDLTGLDVPLLSDTGLDIGFNLLNPGDGAADGNDISIAGLNTPDIALDPLEAIIGDIDINLELPAELTDPGSLVDTVIETVQDLAENLGNLDLANPDEILGILGGQGADGALDIVVGDTVLGDDFAVIVDDVLDDPGSLLEGILLSDITDGLGVDAGHILADSGSLLDTIIETVQDLAENLGDLDLSSPDEIVDDLGDGVTAIVGDVLDDPGSLLDAAEDALDIGDAIDILGQNGDGGDLLDLPGDPLGGLGGLAGGDGNWTESLIDVVGGLLDDVVNGVADTGSSLPDPVATVSEGLGALNIDLPVPVPGLGGLGGLFG